MTKQAFLNLTLIFILGLSHDVCAQDPVINNQVLVRRGNKTLDLNRFEIMSITQNIKSNGHDSIRVTITPDSLYRIGDTLFIKPWFVYENKLMERDDATETRLYYDYKTKTILKIPLKEIDLVKIKRQPLARTLALITTASYISTFVSVFVAAGNKQYNETATQVLFISLPVLAVSWTLHTVLAKKRLRFDPERTTKKVWKF